MSKFNLAGYMPVRYRDLNENVAITDTENFSFDELDENFYKVKYNNYVLTCDEEGIVDFEYLFKITADPVNESLEFRKQRVLNRMNALPPYTMGFYRQKFDEILGAGKYTLTMDYDTHTMTLESSAADQGWFNEIAITVEQTKPCSVVFKNIAAIVSEIGIQEAMSFRIIDDETVPFEYFKTPDMESLTDELVYNMVKSTETLFSKVLVNDYAVISDIEVVNVDDNLTITYVIPRGLVSTINNIKLVTTNNKALLDFNCYIPAFADVSIRHSISLKEKIMSVPDENLNGVHENYYAELAKICADRIYGATVVYAQGGAWVTDGSWVHKYNVGDYIYVEYKVSAGNGDDVKKVILTDIDGVKLTIADFSLTPIDVPADDYYIRHTIRIGKNIEDFNPNPPTSGYGVGGYGERGYGE